LYGFGNKGQRVYNLINKTNVFDNLLKDTRLKEMLDDIFYRNTYHQLYTISSMQANILEPGALAQKLHCDASVPNPLPPWIVRANIGFAVEDFNFKNGGTRFIPGSHLKLRHPTETDYEENKDKIISLDAPKGSMILWHGHVWHQSGENNSQEKRAGIFVAYCATYLLEVSLEENHPLVISKKRKLKLSDELMDLFALNHGIKKK